MTVSVLRSYEIYACHLHVSGRETMMSLSACFLSQKELWACTIPHVASFSPNNVPWLISTLAVSTRTSGHSFHLCVASLGCCVNSSRIPLRTCRVSLATEIVIWQPRHIQAVAAAARQTHQRLRQDSCHLAYLVLLHDANASSGPSSPHSSSNFLLIGCD